MYHFYYNLSNNINFGSDRMLLLPQCQNELKIQIEILREEMITTAMLEGLDSEQTIFLSQKLDQYITTYISMENQNGD
jgi:hypothetical protein